jgi:NADH dehydrogenase (ubiquinone) Fe-S protein 3
MKNSENVALRSGNYLSSVLPFDCIQVMNDEVVCVLQPQYLPLALTFLRDHSSSQLDVLTAITGTDYPARIDRFEVAYELLSVKLNCRLRLKTFAHESGTVESASGIFNSANWWEREIWDMLGLFFSNHPDLRRILTDYGFEGYPLRKDFPLTGYVEVRYDDTAKRVVCEPLELSQEFRSFKFESPWSKSVDEISNATSIKNVVR